MTHATRRHFLNTALLGAAAIATPYVLRSAKAAEPVLIIGGGPAGAHAALSLRAANPDQPVALLERDPTRLGPAAQPGPFTQARANVDLQTLEQASVSVVLDDVVGVDWHAGRVEMFSGRTEAFRTLVMAPGIAPVAESIVGLNARTRHLWPAAWGNSRDARRLAGHLAAAPDAARIVVRLPEDAGGHPDVAAARVRALSRWITHHRPQASLTVLDADPQARARCAFEAQSHGPHHHRLNWYGLSEGGCVLAVDPEAGHLETTAGRISADVVNFISRQGAGHIARAAGLTDGSGWCPFNTTTSRSVLHPQAVVLGDARKTVHRSAQIAHAQGRHLRL